MWILSSFPPSICCCWKIFSFLCVLIGSKHEDGTQSDSENGLGLRFANRRHALEERLKAAHGHVGVGAGAVGGGNITVSGSRATGTRTAFMIEFYDEENPRKRRSYSFSQTAPLQGVGAGGEGLCPQPPSHPKVFSISTSAATTSDSGNKTVIWSCLVYILWYSFYEQLCVCVYQCLCSYCLWPIDFEILLI